MWHLLLASSFSFLGGCCSTPERPMDLGTPDSAVQSFQSAFGREDGPGVYATLHPVYQEHLSLASDTSQLALERILEEEPLSSRIASGTIEDVEVSPSRDEARVTVRASWLFFEQHVEFLLRRDLVLELRGVDLLYPGVEKVVANEFLPGGPPLKDILRLHPTRPDVVYLQVDPEKGIATGLQDRDYEMRSFHVYEVWRIVAIRFPSAEEDDAETTQPE